MLPNKTALTPFISFIKLKKTYDKTHPAVTQGKHSVTKQVNGYLN